MKLPCHLTTQLGVRKHKFKKPCANYMNLSCMFTGKLCFLVLRQKYHTVQAVVSVSESISKQMVKYASE